MNLHVLECAYAIFFIGQEYNICIAKKKKKTHTNECKRKIRQPDIILTVKDIMQTYEKNV